MTADQIIETLRESGSEEGRAGMARFGIETDRALGVSMAQLHPIAREHRRQHALARDLWATGLHEARLLAVLVDDWREVSPDQMDAWVSDFNSWDLCDQACSKLFRKTPDAWPKAFEWSRREREFEIRAGYALVCALAVHDKNAADDRFEAFFPEIIRGATDDRNFVRKAVNWAVRQIGKRNLALHGEALDLCDEILALDTRSARWIARDAIRDLNRPAVMERLMRRRV